MHFSLGFRPIDVYANLHRRFISLFHGITLPKVYTGVIKKKWHICAHNTNYFIIIIELQYNMRRNIMSITKGLERLAYIYSREVRELLPSD